MPSYVAFVYCGMEELAADFLWAGGSVVCSQGMDHELVMHSWGMDVGFLNHS